MSRPLAVVAMSGGVDSSVAAALLLRAGYRVEGISLRLWDSARLDSRVCSDSRDAERVAADLGIEHTRLDFRAEFERQVVDSFVRDYASGRTPNPCVACNSDFKLGVLLDWAMERGAAVVATGHYARTAESRGRRILLRGVDRSHDQSYFLFQLQQRQLQRVVFPVGELTKNAVRRMARDLRLFVADKADSQDLCFGKPASFVAARAGNQSGGEIVDEEGRVLGRHRGVEGFTVGQRRGLGVSSSAALYVQSIERATSRVVVTRHPPQARGVVVREWKWVGDAADPSEELVVQVRYRHGGSPAKVEPLCGDGSPGLRVIRFSIPTCGVAPGQAAVLFRGEEVVGGGWIERILGGGES